MLFRDDRQTSFPRQPVTERDIEIVREHDEQRKKDRAEQINASKYRKEDFIELRDKVLIRNTRRRHKFDPLFWPQPYTVIAIDRNHVTVQNDIDGGILRRQRNDLKKLSYTFTSKNNIPDHSSSVEDIEHWRNSNFKNYENFAWQICDEYNDFDGKLLVQGNCSNSTEIETPADDSESSTKCQTFTENTKT